MKRIILKPRSEFSYLLPEMKEGDVLIHFAPHPQGKNVRYVESNKDKFEIYTEPHWIECGLVEKGLINNLDLINEHLDEISNKMWIFVPVVCCKESHLCKVDLVWC